MTEEDYRAYPIEDRLIFEARGSKIPAYVGRTMDEAANTIITLREELRTAQQRIPVLPKYQWIDYDHSKDLPPMNANTMVKYAMRMHPEEECGPCRVGGLVWTEFGPGTIVKYQIVD